MAVSISALFLLWGCASARVVGDSAKYYGKLEKPAVIYVQRFGTGGVWRVDRDGETLADFKNSMRGSLQHMMLERFPEIAPTYLAPRNLPDRGLLVAGDFTYVEQGSRGLRTAIGFGAGGTRVETAVRLYNLAVSKTQPIVTFRTTSGSNAEPGAVSGAVMSPLSVTNIATSGLSNAASGLSTDLQRTAREIRNFILDKKTLADYARESGGIN